MMSVDVLLFASYADAFGAPSIALDMPENGTVADMLAELRRHPGADALPLRPLVAVNQRYAVPATVIRAGDELAIIPPVAGG